MTTPEVPATNDPLPWETAHGDRYETDGTEIRPNTMEGWNCSGCIRRFKPRPEFDAEVPADGGTPEDRLRIAMLGNDEGGFIDPSSEIPAGEMFRLASECLATELQKARAEVIDWMDANHVGLGMFDQTAINAREHFTIRSQEPPTGQEQP